MIRHRFALRLLRGSSYRAYSTGSTPPGDGSDENNPFRRTLRILGNDMRTIKEFLTPKNDPITEDVSERISVPSKFRFEGDKGHRDDSRPDAFQTHCDVLIIGGGGVGSSIAYWLKQKAREGLNVVVVEKDDTYTKSATRLSVAGLHQQFSLPENLQMSLFGAEFLRNAKEHFGADFPINFTPHGHLVLASDDKSAATLKHISDQRNEFGARNELLTAEKLTKRFPWLNTNGITLGCHGCEQEGWFDPWALLMGYRRAAITYGAHFVHGEVVGFEFRNLPDVVVVGDETTDRGLYEGLDKVVVRMPDNSQRTIKFALCVIAAGANSSQVAQLARIGSHAGLLSVPLPIMPRKRNIYAISVEDPTAPAMGMPLIVDPQGMFIRRDGLSGNYICGRTAATEAIDTNCDLSVDPNYFEEQMRPALANCLPSFANAKLVDSWAGVYDYNVYDENGILGPHPYYNNLYIASGFTAHGIQQTPAVGRAISELIMDGQFRTIDLSRLSFDRLIVDRPMCELSIA